MSGFDFEAFKRDVLRNADTLCENVQRIANGETPVPYGSIDPIRTELEACSYRMGAEDAASYEQYILDMMEECQRRLDLDGEVIFGPSGFIDPSRVSVVSESGNRRNV